MTESSACHRCGVKTYFWDDVNKVWACSRHRVQKPIPGTDDLTRASIDAAVDRAWKTERRAR